MTSIPLVFAAESPLAVAMYAVQHLQLLCYQRCTRPLAAPALPSCTLPSPPVGLVQGQLLAVLLAVLWQCY